MKRALSVAFVLMATTAFAAPGWRQEPAIRLEKTAFREGKLGPSKPSQYVTFDLRYEPFAQVRAELEKRTGLALANRGEAHITIVTPPEFDQLVKVLAPAEIRRVVGEYVSTAKDDVKAMCIGTGAHEKEQTWFVVVEMPSAVKARLALESVFLKKLKEKASPGESPQFKAGEFNPHVTLGFVGRDLHVQDGVVKNLASCKFPIY